MHQCVWILLLLSKIIITSLVLFKYQSFQPVKIMQQNVLFQKPSATTPAHQDKPVEWLQSTCSRSYTASQIQSHHGRRLWGAIASPLKNFYPVVKLSSCQKIFFQKRRIWDWKSSILGKLRAKSKFLSPIISSVENIYAVLKLSVGKKMQLLTPPSTF